MPFSKDEEVAIGGSMWDHYVGQHITRAEQAQRHLWLIHGDDLIGVPEVEPFNNLNDIFKIDRTPNHWWKSIYDR